MGDQLSKFSSAPHRAGPSPVDRVSGFEGFEGLPAIGVPSSRPVCGAGGAVGAPSVWPYPGWLGYMGEEVMGGT